MVIPNPIKGISLRVRIFLSMVLLILITSGFIVAISVYQFNTDSKNYHQERLVRKEIAIKGHIRNILYTTTYPLSKENIPLIFKDRIYELANIHNIEVSIYSLDGKLLKSSLATFAVDNQKSRISANIIAKLESSPDKRYVELTTLNDVHYRSLYAYINDSKFKPLGIIYIPYIEDNSYYKEELRNYLLRLAQINITMLIIAIVLAYFLSRYITASLIKISNKIISTQFNKQNEKITTSGTGKEIGLLISAYNKMIDQIEKSAAQLAQNEREQAWREMAKQVAHEIKNPLTPMRLTVQNFERKFDPSDPNNKQKTHDFCLSLIQQIDTMSAVASAFSNFATMPAQQNERVNLVEVIPLALDIFNKPYISFQCDAKEIITLIDRTQLIRVITNLVKNAIQSMSENEASNSLIVSLFSENETIFITVSDNGKGIEEAYKERIFEPKFTTKTSGMGLGLSIIKSIIESYNGTISFESEVNKGTTFTIQLPKK